MRAFYRSLSPAPALLGKPLLSKNKAKKAKGYIKTLVDACKRRLLICATIPAAQTLAFLEIPMTKVLYCSEVMHGCSFEARGDSQEEVMALAVEHAKSAHGAEISEDLEMTVRNAIREEDEGEEHAQEVLVVDSAGDTEPPQVSANTANEEQAIVLGAADGESKAEEIIAASLPETSVSSESEAATTDEERKGGQAQAAGA